MFLSHIFIRKILQKQGKIRKNMKKRRKYLVILKLVCTRQSILKKNLLWIFLSKF